jgi:superfamily I DNA/RNA helicase
VTDFAVPDDCGTKFNRTHACFQLIKDKIQTNTEIIAITGLSVAGLEFFSLLIAGILMCLVGSRDRRRKEEAQQLLDEERRPLLYGVTRKEN